MIDGAQQCWGTAEERTTFAGESLAVLMAMRTLRLAYDNSTQPLPHVRLPVDNDSVRARFKRIIRIPDHELIHESCADVWFSIRAEKRIWKRKFALLDVKSHEIDELAGDCDYAHRAVSKGTPLGAKRSSGGGGRRGRGCY